MVLGKVEILGDVIDGYNKSVTNKLKIVEVYKKEKLREFANIGKENVGYFNTGDRNTGNFNTGDCNTGNFNSCNYSNGFFNTIDPKINLFNKPTNYTTKEFKQTEWYDALTNGIFTLTEWVNYTEEEKQQDKKKELIDGYLKTYTYKEACENWWKSLSDKDKKIIKTMPNFDKDIFKKITGIEV